MSNIIEMRLEENLRGFNDFLKYIGEITDIKNLTVVEIGSYVGDSTVMFAKKVKHVISIDPFVNNYDVNDETCYRADIPTTVYDEFKKNISPFDNIKHIRKTSDDAINDLLNDKFDLIYIDGVHTYEQVKKDIENYSKILKPNGLLCGHDYANKGHIAGVYRAVNEMIGKPDIVFEDLTWLKKL
jgi:predicted O-methyltransferase YrrM